MIDPEKYRQVDAQALLQPIGAIFEFLMKCLGQLSPTFHQELKYCTNWLQERLRIYLTILLRIDHDATPDQEPESTCEWRDNTNGFVAAGLETLRLVSNLRFQHLFVAKAALSPRTLLNSPRA